MKYGTFQAEQQVRVIRERTEPTYFREDLEEGDENVFAQKSLF